MHEPIMQALFWQISPLPQGMSQPPQWSELLEVSAHCIPHWIVGGEQLVLQDPPTQA
jgi:hypothetical protein